MILGPGSQLLPLNRSLKATALGSQLSLGLELVLEVTDLREEFVSWARDQFVIRVRICKGEYGLTPRSPYNFGGGRRKSTNISNYPYARFSPYSIS